MDQEHTQIDALSRRVRPIFTTLADGGEKLLGERPTMEHALLLLFLITGVYMYHGASDFASAAQRFPKLMAGTTIVFSLLLLARNYLTIVGPLFGALLGGYFVYGGATSFVDAGDGLYYLISGLALLVVSIVFRTRFGAAVESFVAEPVQMMGGDDTGQPPQADEPDDAALEDGPETETESLEDETAAESEAEDEDETEESSAMYVYEIDDPLGPVVTGALCTVYMLLTFSIGMLYATPIFVALWTLWVRMDAIKAVAITVLSFVIAQFFYEFVERDVAQGWLTGWQPPTPNDLLSVSPAVFDVLSYTVLSHVIAVSQWGVPIA